MTTKKHTLTTPTDRTIRVERVYDAPRARVWRAMTEPKLVAQWWGRGNPLDVEKLEPVRGGHWRFVEHSNGQKHGFEGRFGEVKAPERVVQTFEWDGMPAHTIRETIELVDLGDGRTKVVNVSLFFTTEDRDGMLQSGMEGGMAQSQDALERLLATLA
jgi:uncharacterized protein YndB with AHSA1/START domain